MKPSKNTSANSSTTKINASCHKCMKVDIPHNIQIEDMTNQYNVTYPVYYATCSVCNGQSYCSYVHMMNESVSEALREWHYQMYKHNAGYKLQRVRKLYEE